MALSSPVSVDAMNTREAVVSVGMPVFNGGRFLKEAIESFLRQEYRDFELIISDNASTDDTGTICQAYASVDPRIRYVRNETNIGVLDNFNQVLHLARGEYFMWAACDDIWEPGYILQLAGLLREDPQVVLAFCLFDHLDEQGRSVRAYPRIRPLFGVANRLVRANRCIWFPRQEGMANLVYGLSRTAVLKELGGLRVFGRKDYGIDHLLIYRLALAGKFAYHDGLLFHKRQVAGSGTFNDKRFGDWLEYRRLYQKITMLSPIPVVEKILLAISSNARLIVDAIGFVGRFAGSNFRKYLKR